MAGSLDVDSWRVLPPKPYDSLADYIEAGGGVGLTATKAVEPEAIIDELEASGLRGRGGAGFPTGVKWRTVKSFASPVLRTTVVVNAAEGEPGTFKDRTILRANPYDVIEGALIAARAVGADVDHRSRTKAAFGDEVARLARGHRRGPAPRAGAVTSRSPSSRARRVPLRRGDRAARGDRRPASVPAHRAAVPPRGRRGRRSRRRRRLRQRPVGPRARWPAPDDSARPARAGRQRRDDGQRARRSSPRARAWFRTVGTEQVAGHDRLHGHRRRRSIPASPRCRWARPLRAAIDTAAGGVLRGLEVERGPRRRRRAPCSPPISSTRR